MTSTWWCHWFYFRIQSLRKAKTTNNISNYSFHVSHLLIVDDLILHYRSVWSLWALPGQSHAVLAPPLLQHDAHCGQPENEEERVGDGEKSLQKCKGRCEERRRFAAPTIGTSAPEMGGPMLSKAHHVISQMSALMRCLIHVWSQHPRRVRVWMWRCVRRVWFACVISVRSCNFPRSLSVRVIVFLRLCVCMWFCVRSILQMRIEHSTWGLRRGHKPRWGQCRSPPTLLHKHSHTAAPGFHAVIYMCD